MARVSFRTSGATLYPFGLCILGTFHPAHLTSRKMGIVGRHPILLDFLKHGALAHSRFLAGGSSASVSSSSSGAFFSRCSQSLCSLRWRCLRSSSFSMT